MNPERYHKVYEALRRRQHDLTVLYEDLDKIHNLAAIGRSGETVGVEVLHAVTSEKTRLRGLAGRGANRWITEVSHPTTAEACRYLKNEGFTLVATHLGENAIDYRDFDYTQPTAIMMGNEAIGLTSEALSYADANVVIPMMGVVGALNVSVAAAILLFEAMRQRQAAGMYDRPAKDEAALRKRVFEECYPRITHMCREKGLPYPEVDEDGQVIRPSSASTLG
jgi:tRNA (guanosine-2'-O-)-methyltransferase